MRGGSLFSLWNPLFFLNFELPPVATAIHKTLWKQKIIIIIIIITKAITVCVIVIQNTINSISLNLIDQHMMSSPWTLQHHCLFLLTLVSRLHQHRIEWLDRWSAEFPYSWYHDTGNTWSLCDILWIFEYASFVHRGFFFFCSFGFRHANFHIWILNDVVKLFFT